MAPLKWFYSFLRKYRIRMAAGLFLVTIVAAAALSGPYVSKLIVDDVINGGQADLLGKLIAILIALVIVKGVCRFFSQMLFETSSQNVLFSMRETVYRKLLHGSSSPAYSNGYILTGKKCKACIYKLP